MQNAKIMLIARLSLHDETVARLRSMITEGELLPGARIPERELCDRFGIATGHVIGVTKINVDRERERIELERTFVFGNGAIVISDAFKDAIAKPMMGRGIVGIQFDCFLELADRRRKSKGGGIDISQRSVRFP